MSPSSRIPLRLLALPLLAVLFSLGAAGCGEAEGDEGGGSSKAAASAKKTETTTSADSDGPKDGKQWAEPPKMGIDPARRYTAVVRTTEGSFTIELDAKKAPNAVNNFVFLAREGFYTDVPFHRIVKGFVIQTGDPTGTGTGGPGYNIEDDPGGKYERGTVAMANTGQPNSAGSQFFVSLDTLDLPPTYALFGKVTKGMEVVDAIAKTPVEMAPSGEQSQPTRSVEMTSVSITEE